MWHLAADAPTRPECRCCIKINESPTAHPFAPPDRERGEVERARNRGRWGGRAGEIEKEVENESEDSGWWEVRCFERRPLGCVLCFVTWDPPRGIEKAAALIRSESSPSLSLCSCLSIPPLRCANPPLFCSLRSEAVAGFRASVFACVVNGAHGWWEFPRVERAVLPNQADWHFRLVPERYKYSLSWLLPLWLSLRDQSC